MVLSAALLKDLVSSAHPPASYVIAALLVLSYVSMLVAIWKCLRFIRHSASSVLTTAPTLGAPADLKALRDHLDGAQRAFLLAFTFFAALAVLSLLIWALGTPSQPEVVQPAGKPDASTSDTVAIDGSGTIGGLHWVLVILGLAMVAGGAVAFFMGRKISGSLVAAAGLATSLLPNLSVPLTAQFHFGPKIEAKLVEKIDLRIERLLEIIRRSEPGMLASGRFGGFGEGVELFDCNDAKNRKTVGDVNAGIALSRERQLQTIVLLVGSTDRKSLSLPLRRRFDSNAGLARARVNEVERCLNLAPVQGPGLASRAPEVIHLITGPSYTPSSRESADTVRKRMAEDREVRAFVIGVPAHSRP